MIKRLNILRNQLYDFNHQDIKLRWEMFRNQVDETYIIEYAIADKSNKHLSTYKSGTHMTKFRVPRENCLSTIRFVHTNITKEPLCCISSPSFPSFLLFA
jgi:hypothetical protein